MEAPGLDSAHSGKFLAFIFFKTLFRFCTGREIFGWQKILVELKIFSGLCLPVKYRLLGNKTKDIFMKIISWNSIEVIREVDTLDQKVFDVLVFGFDRIFQSYNQEDFLLSDIDSDLSGSTSMNHSSLFSSY